MPYLSITFKYHVMLRYGMEMYKNIREETELVERIAKRIFVNEYPIYVHYHAEKDNVVECAVFIGDPQEDDCDVVEVVFKKFEPHEIENVILYKAIINDREISILHYRTLFEYIALVAMVQIYY